MRQDNHNLLKRPAWEFAQYCAVGNFNNYSALAHWGGTPVPMPQKRSENTDALRSEFAARLAKAIAGISKQEAATKLGISRQMLRLYLKGKATPSCEIVKRACDEWKLSLSVRGFEFSAEAFAKAPRRQGANKDQAVQLSLLELLDRLRSDQLEAKIVGREGDSFYLKLRIKVVA